MDSSFWCYQVDSSFWCYKVLFCFLYAFFNFIVYYYPVFLFLLDNFGFALFGFLVLLDSVVWFCLL